METLSRGACSVPEGFSPVQGASGFLSGCAEFYVHHERPILAVRVQARHLNYVRIAHGGFLATVADSALGIMLRRLLVMQRPAITVNLNLDYLGAVREGDWLEAHVEVHKAGSSFINASCRLLVGERLVLRSNGVFTRWKHPLPHAE